MFWTRKRFPSVNTRLGEFVWDGRYGWECKTRVGENEVTLSVAGDCFDVDVLERFETAVLSLSELVPKILLAHQEDFVVLETSSDKVSLEAMYVDPDADPEDVELGFGFSNWPDGRLTAHCRGTSIVDSHIDD